MGGGGGGWGSGLRLSVCSVASEGLLGCLC